MNTQQHTIRLAEVPLAGNDGFAWNRLHGEREDICKALLKDSPLERKELLQARLRRVDDALDRLMSSSVVLH
jgi:hypothetical protein